MFRLPPLSFSAMRRECSVLESGSTNIRKENADMSNNNNSDNLGKPTADDLLSRLNRRSSDILKAETRLDDDAEEKKESSVTDFDPHMNTADSELDVNELLKNYLPQYADSESDTAEAPKVQAEPVTEEPKKKESLLSRLKRAYSQLDDESSADDRGALQENSESIDTDGADEFEMIENIPPEESEAEDDLLETKDEPESADDIDPDYLLAPESEDTLSEPKDVLPEINEAPEEEKETDPEAPSLDVGEEFSLDELARMSEPLESSEDEQVEAEPVSVNAEADDASEEASENDEIAEEESRPVSDTTTIDKTDLNLMLAFGLEEELNRTMGPKAAEKLKRELDEESKKKKRQEYEYEYTGRNQTSKIAEAYTYTKRSLIIKLVIAVAIALVLCFYENLTLLGIQFAGMLDPAVYPVVYIMGSLQLLLLCAAVAYEQIIYGIKRLFTFRPTPESISAALILFAVGFSIAALFNVELNVEPKMYNFPVAVSVVITLLYSYINIKREIYSFNIVASKRQKFVITKCGELDDEAESIKIDCADFVSGYFARTYEDSPTAALAVGITLAVAAVLAVLIAVYTNFSGASTAVSLNAAYITLLAAMPVSIAITYSYPFLQAAKNAFAMDSAIIGEGAYGEYSNADVACFEDKDIFSPKDVKVQNIRIYNNYRIDRVLYYAASVFSHTKGPLSEVFEVATADIGHSGDIKVSKCGDGYLECVVDDRHIIFGTAASLDELSYKIPDDVLDEDQYASEEISIMYMFIDGMLGAKMYIRYIIDPDLEYTLSDLEYNGMGMCINTFDPNISENMVSARIGEYEIPIKVAKYSPTDKIPTALENADSGIVSRGSPKFLLRTLLLCEKVHGVRRTNIVLAALSMLLAAALLFIIAMSGDISGLLSIYIALYQIVWLLPMLLTSKLFVS